MTRLVPIIAALVCGFLLAYLVLYFTFHSTSSSAAVLKQAVTTLGVKQHQVVGFLPYWLLSQTNPVDTASLTTLTYFGLTLTADGTIQKYTKPGEAEPGWYALQSGKVDSVLLQAKENNVTRSLLLFLGNESVIAELVTDPVGHAQTAVSEAAPLMKQYGFTDLNIDIESVSESSPEARLRFTSFIGEVKKQLQQQHLGTVTVDVSPTDLIKPRLIDIAAVGQLADSIVLMTYDYHYIGSVVTGPVSPLRGAGIDAEYDVETAVQKATAVVPHLKILLGMPLYGYEWETITDSTRSAILPGSGKTISHRRLETVLSACPTCQVHWDDEAKESYVVYEDAETKTIHQVYYPDVNSIQERLKLANQYQLGGVALWALGYEGNHLLDPLRSYQQLLE